MQITLTECRENDGWEGVADDPLHDRAQDLQESSEEVGDSAVENVSQARMANCFNLRTYTRAAPFPAAPRQPIRVHETDVAVTRKPINALLRESMPCQSRWNVGKLVNEHRSRVTKSLSQLTCHGRLGRQVQVLESLLAHGWNHRGLVRIKALQLRSPVFRVAILFNVVWRSHGEGSMYRRSSEQY